jgi:hypothetical protein
MAASRAKPWKMGSQDPPSGRAMAAAGAKGEGSMDGEFIGLTFPVAQSSSFGAFASYVFG